MEWFDFTLRSTPSQIVLPVSMTSMIDYRPLLFGKNNKNHSSFAAIVTLPPAPATPLLTRGLYPNRSWRGPPEDNYEQNQFTGTVKIRLMFVGVNKAPSTKTTPPPPPPPPPKKTQQVNAGKFTTPCFEP